MQIEGLRQVRRKVVIQDPALTGIVTQNYIMVLVPQYRDNLGVWYDFPMEEEDEDE